MEAGRQRLDGLLLKWPLGAVSLKNRRHRVAVEAFLAEEYLPSILAGSVLSQGSVLIREDRFAAEKKWEGED